CTVRALRVVPGNEEGDRERPLGVAAEVVAVRALALDRADETLGPAVGPGVPRPGAGVANPRGAAGIAEGIAPVRRAVVAEHALDADAVAGEEGQGPLEEASGLAALE